MPMSPLILFLFLFLFTLLFSSSASSTSRSRSRVTHHTHFPGFQGPLPFRLETGYVGVEDVELFYYFIQSERDPINDPLVLWLNGGPGCSTFSGLAFEIGPLKFRNDEYNGSLPTLDYHPYAWTKVSSIIFLESPVGTGYSYSEHSEGYEVGDIKSCKQVHKFLLQWLSDHPQFLANDFYVAGDSYGGKFAPVVMHEIIEGIGAGHQPSVNLKGYFVGNPVTGDKIDENSRVPYLHGVGIISDELYESAVRNCEGQDHRWPSSEECATTLNLMEEFISEIMRDYILDPKCDKTLKISEEIVGRKRFLKEYIKLQIPSPVRPIWCRTYVYYLAYYWANSDITRKALGIKEGTVREWQRCTPLTSFTKDIPSVLEYHFNVTSRGYRSLVYSGDHDASTPFLGTQAWIRSLNFSIVDDWRSWRVGGQVAGYTRTYANNMTFATVKNAGHTAPEYQPKECLAMLSRWLSHNPL